MIGVAQTEFVRTGRLDELQQAGALRLPTEMTNAPVSQSKSPADRHVLAIWRCHAMLQPLRAFLGNDDAIRNLIDQTGAEQSRGISLRNVHPLWKTNGMPAAIWDWNKHSELRTGIGRQAHIDLFQSFLEFRSYGRGMDHPLAWLVVLAHRPHRKCRDIVTNSTAAADAVLHVTGDA